VDADVETVVELRLIAAQSPGALVERDQEPTLRIRQHQDVHVGGLRTRFGHPKHIVTVFPEQVDCLPGEVLVRANEQSTHGDDAT
jgi:hypothetical protein